MSGMEIRYGATMGPVGQRLYELVSRYPKAHELYVTSGYRNEPGSHHSGLSWNGSPTAALDIGAWDYGVSEGSRRMRDLAKWLDDNFRDCLVELIHTTPYNDDNGFYVRDGARYEGYGAQLRGEHANHIHVAGSAASIDRALARTGSPEPPPVVLPDIPTIYGWDASDFNDIRRDHLDWARREDVAFFVHKVSERGCDGIHIHEQYGQRLNWANELGFPFLGGYVVVRTGIGISAQADTAIEVVERDTPWYKSHPGWFWMVDVEKWEYDAVDPKLGEELAIELEKRTGKPVIMYASQGQYGDGIPNPSRPLWNANYTGSGAPGKWWTQWARRGGWAGAGTKAYSGRQPVILQFASDAEIGGLGPCDANAFRGTADDFRKLLANITPGKPVTPEKPPVEDPVDPPPVNPPSSGELHGWRRSVRTAVWTLVATCTVLLGLVPQVVGELEGDLDARTYGVLTGVAGVITVIATLVTRVMALPVVEATLKKHVPWLAAEPRK